MSIHALNTEADYDAALARLAAIMDTAPDTPERKEADALATLIEAYEEKHFPIPPISFVAATWDEWDSEDFSDLENAPADAPTKAILDAAQRDYDANPDAGAPFDEVMARLRKPRP
jgi:antitoxin component HigA of HigAB toxin-antitoxin module